MSYAQSPTSSGAGGHVSIGSSGGTTPTTIYSPVITRGKGKEPAAVDKIVTTPPRVDDDPRIVKIYGGTAPYRLEGDAYYQERHSGPTRYLVILAYPDGTVPDQRLRVVGEVMKLYDQFRGAVPLEVSSTIRIRFDAIDDACWSKYILRAHGFQVDYVTLREFAQAKFQDIASMDLYEGQIQISVATVPATHDSNTPELSAILANVLGVYGQLHGKIELIRVDNNALFTFRAEFRSVDAANRSMSSLKRHQFADTSNDGSFRWGTTDVRRWVAPYHDPHGPSIQSSVDGSNRKPVSAGGRHPSDHHNQVRRDRIVSGSDVRTTVMLRNIPNKMDWLGLKAILDEFCFGKYDFSYLRIDFTTGCNVGYAFVNFVDSQAIINMLAFVEKRTWVGFRTSKSAEISYATIQGRDALVQKFRNSSVMAETYHCRPRLFWSSLDLAPVNANIVRLRYGTEQAFPRPDNAAKLQRSMDSARTIGLYPPNGGNVVDHRQRLDGFDNGNPRATAHQQTNYNEHMLPGQLRRAVEYVYNGNRPGFPPVSYDNIPGHFLAQFWAFAASNLHAPVGYQYRRN